MKYTEKEKKAYYNKIMVQNTMSVEEAENIIDDMYQDKFNVIEEKNTIYLNRLDDVKFTNLEFASVRMLREVQSLRRELERQQKEIEELLENSVPKETIRNLIKECKELIKTKREDELEKTGTNTIQLCFKERILKELLGE